MSRRIVMSGLALLCCAAQGCGEDDGTSPAAVDLAGRFVGAYTASNEPGLEYLAALNLTQSQNWVFGNLATDAMRTAKVSGSVSRGQLTMAMDFIDACSGSGSAVASILDGGLRLEGSYSASDCNGEYTGTFSLEKKKEVYLPRASITSPQDGAGFTPGSPITFTCACYDLDGGTVQPKWSSDIDGSLFTGRSFTSSDLSLGTHNIALFVIDDELQTRSDTISITISDTWALHFERGHYAVTPDTDALDLSATFTLEMWIKRSDENEDQHLLSKWGIYDYEGAWFFENWYGVLQLVTRDAAGGSTTTLRGGARVQNDIWQHVAAVFDNGEARLYVNGTLNATRTGMHVPQATEQPVFMGREKSGAHRHYTGVIDEVRVWNVARSATEIAANMNVGLAGDEPGLVAYWPLDDANGDLAFDATGNGHDMRLGDAAGPDAADPTWVTPGKL